MHNDSYHNDEYWMQQAMQVAQQAQVRGEVPVGAIIVRDNKCLAQSGNQSITDHDPTAHAEISAIRSAAKKINNYRLLETTLYVTLEPCMMCAGAMLHARIQRLVFGAYDHRTGVAGGCFDWLLDEKHLHKITITGGVLKNECAQMLQDFFKAKR